MPSHLHTPSIAPNAHFPLLLVAMTMNSALRRRRNATMNACPHKTFIHHRTRRTERSIRADIKRRVSLFVQTNCVIHFSECAGRQTSELSRQRFEIHLEVPSPSAQITRRAQSHETHRAHDLRRTILRPDYCSGDKGSGKVNKRTKGLIIPLV